MILCIVIYVHCIDLHIFNVMIVYKKYVIVNRDKHLHYICSYIFFYREIMYAIRHNRWAKSPFQLHLTSYDASCDRCKLLLEASQNIMGPFSSVKVSPEHHIELFEKHKLIYLSPDSKDTLQDFDEDDIYVVGALHGGGNCHKHSLASAKATGIRHASIPSKQHIGFRAELNVDHVVAALLDFKETRGDWFYALRWVPSRFLRNANHGDRYTPHGEATFMAHSALSPNTHPELESLTPTEYRKRYGEILSKALTATVINRTVPFRKDQDGPPRKTSNTHQTPNLADILQM